MLYKITPNTLSTTITKHYQGQKASITSDYNADDKGVMIGRLQRSDELKASVRDEVVATTAKGQTVDVDYIEFKIKQSTPDTVNLFNTKRAIAPFQVRVAKNKALYATPSTAFEEKVNTSVAKVSVSQFWS